MTAIDLELLRAYVDGLTAASGPLGTRGSFRSPAFAGPDASCGREVAPRALCWSGDPLRGFAAFGAALLVVLLTIAPPLAAQDEQALSQARAQFNEAIALQTAGDCAGALEKLQAVARIKLTPHVQFNIALCEERLGRLVAALGHYRLALVDAEAQSISDVSEPARAAIESLEGRIPRLVIVRGSGAARASIALDATVLGDANIGSELRRDPGPHRIVGADRRARRCSRTPSGSPKARNGRWW